MGTVSSGCGEGAKFTRLPWAMGEFESKLGFAPFPGTFNLEIEGQLWVEVRARLMGVTGVTITPEEGFCSAKCFPVVLENRIEGAVVLPQLDDYPHNKLEVLSKTAVRQTLEVVDGDRLSLRIWLDPFQAPLESGLGNHLE